MLGVPIGEEAQHPPQTLAVNDTVRVYPGCDRTPATCNTRFGNLTRFLGLGAMLPQRNPFGPTGFNANL